MASQQNGPSVYIPMYSLKPYQSVDVIKLPNVMYKVKSYYSTSYQAWRSCVSRRQSEDERMLSTYDSEPMDRCQEPLFGVETPSATSHNVSLAGTPGSVAKFPTSLGQGENGECCRPMISTPRTAARWAHGCSSSPSLSQKHRRPNPSENSGLPGMTFHGIGYCSRLSPLRSESGCTSDVVDPSECALSREYIVKTYIIQNATPSPSPITPAKFPPAEGARGVNSSPSIPLSSLSQEEQASMPGSSPLAQLERRQEDVLRRLEQLQASVSQLASKYHMSSATRSSSSSSTTSISGLSEQVTQLPSLNCSVQELVVSADPSSPPLSLIILCEQLSCQRSVFKTTFVHSSLSDSVPEGFQKVLVSNGNLRRADSQVAVTLIWKKVNDPQLMVDPMTQSPIVGEANIARYLARLFKPPYDASDIVTTTRVDELLDVAQLQLIEGNAKEKAAGLRTLNSALGKRDWLMGSEPCLADFVCWSALKQTGLASSPPANVKKWLALCVKHKLFSMVADLLS